MDPKALLWSPKVGEPLPDASTPAGQQLADFLNEQLVVEPHPLCVDPKANTVAWASLLQGCKANPTLAFMTDAKLRPYTEKILAYAKEFKAVPDAAPNSIPARMAQLTDVANLAESTSILNDEKAPKVSLFDLFRYATGFERVLVCIGLLAAFVQGAGMPAFSFIFGKMINDMMSPEAFIPVATPTAGSVNATTPDPVAALFGGTTDTPFEIMIDKMNTMAIWMLIVGAVALVAGFFQIALLAGPARLNVARLRTTALHSVLQHEMGWFDRPHFAPAEVALRIQSDANKVHTAIGEKLSTAVMSLSTFIVSIVVAFILSWRVTLILLAMSPLLAIFGAWMAIATTKGATLAREAGARSGSWATDCLLGLRTISALTAEKQVKERYGMLLRDGQMKNARKAFMVAFGLAGLYGSFSVCWAWAVWWAARWVEDGVENVGTVLAVFFCVVMGVMSLGQFFGGFGDVQAGMAASFRLFAVIDRDRTVERHPPVPLYSPGGVGTVYRVEDGTPAALPAVISPYDVAVGAPLIEFDHVSFAYAASPSAHILKDVSLTIRKGERVAFVGHTGCGKSTLLSMIARLYDPTMGVVRMGGRPLKDWSVATIRDGLGVVSQEPVLFSGTVRENLKMAVPSATEAEVASALEVAGVMPVVQRLPNGLDTYIGDGGALLSGGQKQLIATARALLRKPKLLLLDEATSALDRSTEMTLSAALDGSQTDVRTSVIVAHRLVTIKDCDCIYVMSPDTHGVIEHGTHQELLRLKGVYYTMAAAQGLVETPHAGRAAAAFPTSVVDDDDDDVADVDINKGVTRASADVRDAARLHKDTEPEAEEDPEPSMFICVGRVSLRWWPLLIIGLLGSIAAGLMYPLFAIAFTQMTKALAPYVEDRDEEAWRSVAFFGFLALLSFFGNLLQVFTTTYVGDRVTMVLREATFATFVHAPKKIFDVPATSPSATAALIVDSADSVQAVFGSQLTAYLRTITGILTGLAIAFYYSWEMACVLLVVVPVLAGVSAIQMALFTTGAVTSDEEDKAKEKAEREKKRRELEKKGKKPPKDDFEPPTAVALAVEAVTQVKTAQLMQMEQSLVTRFEGTLKPELSRAVRNAVLSGIAFGIAQFIGLVMFAIALWFGARFLIPDRASFDDVMTSTMALLMSASGAGESTMFTTQVADAKRTGGKLFPLMAKYRPPSGEADAFLGPPPTSHADPHAGKTLSPNEFRGRVSLEGVSFSYPSRPGALVLNNVSLGTNSGKFLAVVGATGSGKSTVAQLIERFYEPASGCVRYAGHLANEIDLQCIRTAIGYVPQEPCLFDSSVLDNVLLGAPAGTTRQQAEEACRAAHMHEHIMKLTSGYDTPVGPRGSRLSGGQRQRLAIARALVRDPQLLILDEATAALDAVTEAAVHEQIMDVSRKRGLAVLAIAHRLPAIKGADEVVVLENGVIVERGTLAQLIAADGGFAARWKAFQGTNAK